MKTASAFLALALTTSCAFKKPESAYQAQTETFPLTLKWRKRWESNRADQNLQRQMIRTQSGYRASEPLTLYEKIPLTLELNVEIPVLQAQPTEAFGEILTGGRNVSIPVHLSGQTTTGNRTQLSFEIRDLDKAFPEHATVSGMLRVQAFHQGASVTSIEIALRTPPSAVDVGFVQLRDWIPACQVGRDEFLAPKVNETQLNLVRVLKLLNRESFSVQIEFPRRPDGRFVFVPETRESTALLSDFIALIPFDSKLPHTASAILKSPGTKSTFSISVPAQGEMEIGIYAVGHAADEWMQRGPQGGEAYPGVVLLNLTNSAFGLSLPVRYADLNERTDPESRLIPIPQDNLVVWPIKK